MNAIIAKHYFVLLQQVESDSTSVGISATTSISYALKTLLNLLRDEKHMEDEYPLLFIHLRSDNIRRYTKNQ